MVGAISGTICAFGGQQHHWDLAGIFQVAIKVGARFGNPTNELKRVRLNQKKLILPTREQFLKLVETMERGGSRHVCAARHRKRDQKMGRAAGAADAP